MLCIYKIIDIKNHIILVEYYPPIEIELPFTSVRLPFRIDADTTQEDVAARVESAIPIEDWELELDKQERPYPDLSAMIDVEVEIDVGVVAARSMRQRGEDQAAAAIASGQIPELSVPIEV